MDEELRIGDDGEWLLRAMLIYGYHDTHIPKILYRYRRHAGQITRSKDANVRVWEGRVRTLTKHRFASTVEMSPSLREHWLQQTRMLRRIYLPVILLLRLLAGLPFTGLPLTGRPDSGHGRLPPP